MAITVTRSVALSPATVALDGPNQTFTKEAKAEAVHEAPPRACLGAAMSDAQLDMVERLEGLTHFLTAPAVATGDLGRAGEKFGNLFGALQDLTCRVPLGDLHSFFSDIHQAFDAYSRPSHAPDFSPGQDVDLEAVKQRQSDHQECVRSAPSTRENICPAKEVVASRIKWKLGPRFDPRPYLSDPVVRAAYDDPDVLRKDPSQWPVLPRAKVHCSKSELLALAAKWDALGACCLIPTHSVPREEAVGLFAVSKDTEFDRLIVNPTVINSRMHGRNAFTKTIAPGHLLSLLRLEQDEVLRVSSDDLSEFYYTFAVSAETGF